MQIDKWEKLSSKTIHRDKWIHVTSNKFRNNQKLIDPYYLLHYPEWVNVVAITPDHKILIIKQYRPGPDRVIYELPAGAVDESESIQEAGLRELKEETGFVAAHTEVLSKFTANAATHTNYCHAVLARNVMKTSKPNLDDTEWVESHVISFKEMDKLIDSGQFIIATQVAAYLFAKSRYPEIFQGS